MDKRVGWCIMCVITVSVAMLLAYGCSAAVTIMAENVPIQRKNRIVIDAGHGLPDGGAVSCTGTSESEYNLQIARRLQELMHLLGFETVMTRNSGDSVHTKGTTIAQKKISDLKERVRIISETENALLLSIHQNNFPDGKYSGAVVLYADTAGSKELAQATQQSLVRTLNPGSKRACKPADGIYLMEHINCTGILIECGFLSNPAEEAKLRSDSYQKKLCCVIAGTLCEFLDEEHKKNEF